MGWKEEIGEKELLLHGEGAAEIEEYGASPSTEMVLSISKNGLSIQLRDIRRASDEVGNMRVNIEILMGQVCWSRV